MTLSTTSAQLFLAHPYKDAVLFVCLYTSDRLRAANILAPKRANRIDSIQSCWPSFSFEVTVGDFDCN